MNDPIKIGIVGVGNVGRILGVKLSSCGYFVEAVTGVSPHNIKIDNYYAYEISGDFGELSYLVRVVDTEDDLSNDLDVVFVCTKIHDAIEICKKIKSKIKEDGAIVTIQNMFWIDDVMSIVPDNNLVYMILDFACITNNNETQVINFDGIKLGICSKEAYHNLQRVHDILVNICKVQDTNDFMGLAIGRNIINTAIASLGGLSALSLGEILNDRIGKYLFVKIIEEEVELFKFLKINILPYDNKLNYYLFTSKTLKGFLYRKKIIKLLKKNNFYVQSSALRDFENKHKSELLIVLQNFLKKANKHGINTPNIQRIFDMLIEVSQNKRDIDKKNFLDKILLDLRRKS